MGRDGSAESNPRMYDAHDRVTAFNLALAKFFRNVGTDRGVTVERNVRFAAECKLCMNQFVNIVEACCVHSHFVWAYAMPFQYNKHEYTFLSTEESTSPWHVVYRVLHCVHFNIYIKCVNPMASDVISTSSWMVNVQTCIFLW